MRGMVWELKRLHWIDFGQDSFFRDLQRLRNIAAHEHDRIDERIASSIEMKLLFAYFEAYIQRTFKQLTDLPAMKGAGGGLEKAG
jgi:uncharacterized protein YutE (UPF0331/DUF86 family)